MEMANPLSRRERSLISVGNWVFYISFYECQIAQLLMIITLDMMESEREVEIFATVAVYVHGDEKPKIKYTVPFHLPVKHDNVSLTMSEVKEKLKVEYDVGKRAKENGISNWRTELAFFYENRTSLCDTETIWKKCSHRLLDKGSKKADLIGIKFTVILIRGSSHFFNSLICYRPT